MTVPIVPTIARGPIVRRKADPMHVGCVVSVSRRRSGPIAKVYWFALGADENAIPVDQCEATPDAPFEARACSLWGGRKTEPGNRTGSFLDHRHRH
jgi:hypothetical protein